MATPSPAKPVRFVSTDGRVYGYWEAEPLVLVDDNGSPQPLQQNLKVQQTNPGLTQPGIWVQTYANGDLQIWIEDGT